MKSRMKLYMYNRDYLVSDSFHTLQLIKTNRTNANKVCEPLKALNDTENIMLMEIEICNWFKFSENSVCSVNSVVKKNIDSRLTTHGK